MEYKMKIKIYSHIGDIYYLVIPIPEPEGLNMESTENYIETWLNNHEIKFDEWDFE